MEGCHVTVHFVNGRRWSGNVLGSVDWVRDSLLSNPEIKSVVVAPWIWAPQK